MLMLKWNDYTDRFHEYERFWRGRYLELCEVAEEEIELNLYLTVNNSGHKQH